MCETPLGKYNKPNNFNQEMNFDQRECRVLNRQLAGVATPGPMTPHFKRVKRTTTMLSEGGSPSTRVRAAASQSSFTARCFVPETLIDYIHNKVHGELKPASFFLKGVCLLVDISGFTKLSGAFCAQGKNGIDGLQLATNGFMGKLVEIIYSFGGDIIKFAGDAIICIFYSKRSLQDVVVKSQTAYSPVSPSHQAMLKIDSNSDKSGGESVIQSRQLSLKHPDNDEDGEETDETEMYTDKGAKYSILTPEEIQPEIVLKAIRCALELRDVETDKLTVHVAMSCGEMCFGILGGYENRWECLISGACIHELSDCLDDAPSKHAALTNQCYQVLNTHSQKKPSAEDNVSGYDYLSQVQLQRLKSGNYMIISADSQDGFGTEYLAETPRSTPLPPLISQFVPVPISAGLEYTTGLSYLAEIREVTTMFMKWESYDAEEKHRDLMRLQAFFHPAQKILHSTGAFLRQFLVDDKGCVLIACWGMPSLSYLDNPHRALSAAAQIRAKLNKMNMKCSFGITTGDVYCGTVGSSLRMEYAAIGNVVNMAARLMGKAHEGILIDQESYSQLPDNVQPSLERLEPIQVKGREEPLEVYRYSGEGSILIGDDVVEDHEVREVCKVTFLKLLDNMKAPGRFSVFRRRQSVTKVKEWLSDSVKRGGDLVTMHNASNKSADSGKGGIYRSSFRASIQMSFSSNRSSANNAMAEAQAQAIAAANGSGRGASAIGTSSASTVHPHRRSSAHVASNRAGVYQHDDLSYRHIHEIPYVLMEGRRGAGKSSIVNWLKKQASDRSIPVFRARLSRDDMMVDYSVWMKVFKQLMPKEMYKNKTNQALYLTPLLHTVYQEDLETMEHVALPSLRRALGITCEIDIAHEETKVSGDAVKPSHTRIKVTARLVTETLLKIFAHLLNEKPELIIIENIQYADEESLNVLLGLTHLHTLSAVVLTGLGPDSLSGKKSTGPHGAHAIQRIDSFDSEMPGGDEMDANLWYNKFRGSVMFYDHATLITLDDFAPHEIDKMLCDALNLIQVPHEISQLVQDLSGGSFFWVKEIMHFLQEHGREEFLSAIGKDDDHGHRRSGTNSNGGITSPRTSGFEGGLRLISQAANYTRKSILKRMSTMTSPENSVNPKKTTKFKLESLVVCRFEKLTVDVQHVLRTASIIGVHFHTALLYGVLPTYLQCDMQPHIDSLLRQKWIHQDAEDPSLYQFTHPYAHKIIYDLTPSSERNHMHQIIADYIEHTNFDDPAQFPLLCQHNSHCNPEKAFHYTFKAITHLLDKGSAYEIGQCVDLLQDALPLLSTVVDADVLQIMVYNVRKRVDELGAEKGSTKFASLAASTLAGGLFGAVTALSSRWRGGAGARGANAVTPLTIIDEGVSGKSSRSVASTKADPTSISGKGAASFKNAVKKVIDTNVTSPPNSARLTGGIASGSSKKESREFASNDRAKAYFKEKLKILDSNIDTKVSQFTSAEKYGEHKDWQHTLIMQTPKKELALVASPVKFFSRAGSATKQFFAPYFKRSASLASQVSGEQQSQSNLQNQSTNDLGSQVAEPAGDQSMVSYANRQHRNEGSATWE